MLLSNRAAQEELAQQLISHMLGFQSGEINFQRSLQYVCSNLYHHSCLSPDQRQVHRQMQGVLLKLQVHGLQQHSDTLQQLVEKWTQGGTTPDQSEARWAVLSLLLQLSHNPTDHRLYLSKQQLNSDQSMLPRHQLQWPPEQTEGDAAASSLSSSLTEEGLLQQLLDDRDTLPRFRYDEALSDWSDESSSSNDEKGGWRGPQKRCSGASPPHRRGQGHGRRKKETRVTVVLEQPQSSAGVAGSSGASSKAQPKESATAAGGVSIPDTSMSVPDSNVLVADPNTFIPDTSLLVPDISSLVPDTASGVPDVSSSVPDVSLSPQCLEREAEKARIWLRENTQQQCSGGGGTRVVPERALVRELLDAFTWPQHSDALLTSPPATDTLSQGSVQSLLLPLQPLLQQLCRLEQGWLGQEEAAGRSYTAGLHHWRNRLLARLLPLVEVTTDHARPCTLVWLLSELEPLYAAVAAVHDVHAVLLQHNDCPRLQQLRLLGALIAAVEAAVTADERSALLRLLLATLEPLLLFVQQGTRPPSLLYRDPSVSVKSHQFWDQAYAETPENRREMATIRGLSLALTTLSSISHIAKCRELLEALQLADSDDTSASDGLADLPTVPTDTAETAPCLQSDDGGDSSSVIEELLHYIEDLNSSADRNSNVVPGSSSDRSTSPTLHDLLHSQQRRSLYDPFLARYGQQQQLNEATTTRAMTLGDSDEKEVKERTEEKDLLKGLGAYDTKVYYSATRQLEKKENIYRNNLRHFSSKGPKHHLRTGTALEEDPLLELAFGGAEDQLDGHSSNMIQRLLSVQCRQHVSGRQLLAVVEAACVRSSEAVMKQLAQQLHTRYHLGAHVSAVCGVMLLQPANIMSGFTTAVFDKTFTKHKLNAIDLTEELRDNIERVHPGLSKHFTVLVRKLDGAQQAAESSQPAAGARDGLSDTLSQSTATSTTNGGHSSSQTWATSGVLNNVLFPDDPDLSSLNIEELTQQQETKDLADLFVDYQVGWPLSVLLTPELLQQYNAVLQFSLRLRHALHVLNGLHFKDMSGWELVQCQFEASSAPPAATGGGGDDSPLSWRLHRLQLLRHWLLHFCRVLHGHFTTCVLMPFSYHLHRLMDARPSLDTFIEEHRRLVTALCQQCLLSTGVRDSPVQLALKQVLSVVQSVRLSWRQGGCDAAELSTLESSYAACHRFLLRLLSTLVTSGHPHHQHLRGLIDALSSSCPVNV